MLSALGLVATGFAGAANDREEVHAGCRSTYRWETRSSHLEEDDGARARRACKKRQGAGRGVPRPTHSALRARHHQHGGYGRHRECGTQTQRQGGRGGLLGHLCARQVRQGRGAAPARDRGGVHPGERALAGILAGGIYRGFRSLTDAPDALLMAIIGGPDAGKVDWHPSVLEEARKTGLSVDDEGNLIIEKPAA